MNLVRKLKQVTDVELRIIKAAAELEKLLQNDEQEESLGEMVQKEARFRGGAFLKDLNFSLGIRNDIAHARRKPTYGELNRASDYLLRAIGKITPDVGNRLQSHSLLTISVLGIAGFLILFVGCPWEKWSPFKAAHISERTIPLNDRSANLDMEAIDDHTSVTSRSRESELGAENALTYFNRGFSKFKVGDYSGAIPDYNMAIQFDSKFADAYHYRGFSRYSVGDFSGAISDYNKAEELGTKVARLYLNRGRSKQSLGDCTGAISDCDKAIKLDSKLADAFRLRGLSKSRHGDDRGAIPDYNKGIELGVKDAWAYLARGLSKQRIGDHAGAISDYEEVIKIDPTDVTARENRDYCNQVLEDCDGLFD